jgi:tripartite ATP-independent transporter DctM subunit
MELAILGFSFTVLLLLGVPVAFAIGLSSVATILAAGLPVAVVFQKMVGGMQVFSFLAIPFFVFAGELMLYGGIADRIVKFANSLVGHVRGGLGMSNVLGCTIFGGIAGSPLADVSAIGSVMIPLMKKEGYDADYAVNVTTHAALVGAIMPTSHNLIIFTLATAGIASVSIVGLILAGLVPAIILTFCNLAAAYYVAVKRGYPTHGKFPGWSVVLMAFLAALPGLFVVVIILVGILSGAFTATESASIAVAWALLVTVFVYRSLTWDHFLMACAKACKTTGVVLLLIGISSAFGYFMALYEVPQITGELMKRVSSEPWVIFLMINILLFVLGTFLDMAATILICTPIFMPIAMQFGMDPLQFGIASDSLCKLVEAV